MAKSNTIIQLRGVEKYYGSQKILEPIDLDIKDGEFLTFLGPSGCGKTTLLRLLAGLEKPTSGKILIDGKDATDLAPQERHINTVFQSYALFPHMTVYDNIAFGLRCDGVTESEIHSRVKEMLRIVRLQDFEKRKPKELSGGQQQRVAIARAMVKEPVVLLLDEPLSSLDYRLRKNMQIELKQLQRRLGITFVFVTHDQEEALSMSDKIVVLQQGRLVQQGTPREIYENPKNLFAASFIGECNLFDVHVDDVEDGILKINIQGIQYELLNRGKFSASDRVLVLIRPEDLRVYHDNARDTKRMFAAQIHEVIYKGTTIDLILKLPDGTLLSATKFFDEDDGHEDTYAVGESVWVNWPLGWEVILPHEK